MDRPTDDVARALLGLPMAARGSRRAQRFRRSRLVRSIVTSSSPDLAASVASDEVLALRRLPEQDRVALFVGSTARTR